MTAAALRLAPASPGFPSRLATLRRPPAGLWVKSLLPVGAWNAALWKRPAVALVGARAAGFSGLEIARQMAWDLARAGVVVVSGMARGIDAAAHEGALLGGGRTVAVLGCGIDRIYPPEHASLAERILERGALISEWPADTAPKSEHFPQRNRWISGLSDVVVLVEAGVASGALHTVRYALEEGREVMAVPRDPLGEGCAGSNRLLREGAAPAIDASDILALLKALGKVTPPERPEPAVRAAADGEAFGGPGASAAPGAPGASAAFGSSGASEDASAIAPDVPAGETPAAALQDDGPVEDPLPESAVVACLRRGGALSLADLAERLPAMPAGDLLAELLALEIERRASRDRLGRYRWEG